MVFVRVPSDPKYLCMLRTVVQQFCLYAGLAREDSEMVTLAIDEACTNIIRHTYEGCPDRAIVLQCSLSNSDIVFELRDSGKQIDPGRMKARDLSEIRPGGLGMHFIRTIMDGMQLEYDPQVGNILKLTKHIPAQQKAG